jgi:hypothetical protein
MDHRIDRLDRTLQFFDQTNKRMTRLLDTLEASRRAKRGDAEPRASTDAGEGIDRSELRRRRPDLLG